MTEKIKQAKKRNGRPSKFDSLTYEDISQIRWLAAQGFTHHELAQHLNINNRTLKRWREKTDNISIDLNSAIAIGQSLYNSPIAAPVLYLTEEIDRIRNQWIKTIERAWGNRTQIRFHQWHDQEHIMEALKSCYDLKQPTGLKAFKLLSELHQIHAHLRSLAELNTFLRNKKSWERFTSKEPLKWDLLDSLHRKFKNSEK